MTDNVNDQVAEKAEEVTEMVQGAVDTSVDVLTTYGLDVVGAVLTLIFGMWAASVIAGAVRRSLGRAKKVDDMLIGFLSSMVRYAIVAFTIIAVLNQFGIETTSLVAVLGAAGLAIGLALQGTLSNVAAGVMLLIFRPFKVGDFVNVAGHAGTVKDLNLFVTTMATPDNVKIIVPNGKIWGDSLKNFSANATRRVDFTFGVSYNDDLDKVEAVLHDLIKAESRILADPAPAVMVGAMGDSSVDFIVRVWVNAPDYWGVFFDMTKATKQRFDKEDINIPFPTRTLYVEKND